MINEVIQKHLVPSDEFIYGTADLQGLIDEKYNGFHYGISIGKKLDDRIIDKIENGPTREYYDHYMQINNELSILASNIKKDLEKINICSIVIEPTFLTDANHTKDYYKTLRVDISHKMVATRAGLGWIGKTDLFVSSKFGTRVRLVSLLINKKTPINTVPVEKSKCGNCIICVDKCPARAANGLLWDIHTDRDKFFDAHACKKKCAELSEKIKIDRNICGICVAVCPLNRRQNACTNFFLR